MSVLIGPEHSPEARGYRRAITCPSCGNTERFIGWDDAAYPGADCECGAWGGETDKECTCTTLLKQSFYVNAEGDDWTFDAHDGAEDSEIGAYTRISCADCHQPVWVEKPEYLTDGLFDASRAEAPNA